MNTLIAVVCYGKVSTMQICHVLNQLRTSYRIILPDEGLDFEPTHVILSGGPMHVYENDSAQLPKWVLELPVPVLGICYGMQLIAYTFGGLIMRLEKVEKGLFPITEYINGHTIIKKRWINRIDYIAELPAQFEVTGNCSCGIVSFTDHHKWWAIQYHPETYKYQDLSVFRAFLKKKYNRINV